MSGTDSSDNAINNKAKNTRGASADIEKNLKNMESLLKQSALGTHVLFDNSEIATVLKDVKDDADFFNIEKMKKVQDHMTALVAKKNYHEKLNFLSNLDAESYHMLVRTYFHIVDNTARETQDWKH